MADALNASNLDTCYDAPIEVAAKRDGRAAEDGEGDDDSGTEIEWVSVYREDDSCSSVTCGVVVGVALSAVCVWGVKGLCAYVGGAWGTCDSAREGVNVRV